jgi:hypothetical protein
LAGVRGRVLKAGEMRGYIPQGQRLLGINARSWVIVDQSPQSQQTKEAAFLSHLGFIAGVREDLLATSGDGSGLSTVEEFRSAVGARTELAAVVKSFLASVPGSAVFTVPGVPGARGFALSHPGLVGVNVGFVTGRYCYLVGAGGSPRTPGAPKRAAVIAGARHLYHRVT